MAIESRQECKTIRRRITKRLDNEGHSHIGSEKRTELYQTLQDIGRMELAIVMRDAYSRRKT